MSEELTITSLSARQVHTLLRTLRQHHEYLEAGHDDARRFAVEGTRPSYIVDFDLLYRYMFLARDHPDWQLELSYLFTDSNNQFVIGPGTQTEIDAFVQGFVRGQASSTELDRDQIHAGLGKLYELIGGINFVSYAAIADPVAVDVTAFETMKAALDKTRWWSTDEANRADALNWASVIYLRQLRRDGVTDIAYPYLLTSTRPLLNESVWSPELRTPVSRGPAEAIYSTVMFRSFADSEEATAHTVEMALKTARLEHMLRQTPAYRQPEAYEVEPDWERGVIEGRMTPHFRKELARLRSFVGDPVVEETQRVYDNARRAATIRKWRKRQTDAREEAAPTHLFDLIAGIDAALSQKVDGSKGLAAVWDTVLKLEPRFEANSESVLEVRDRVRDKPGRPYLVTEVADRDGRGPQFVARWPASADTRRSVDAVSAAFTERGITKVSASVATDGLVHTLPLSLPVTLDGILEAVKPSRETRSRGEPDVSWVRMNGGDQDAYIDVSVKDARDPAIGLIGGGVDPGAVAALYADTSARYLFQAWVVEAVKSSQAQLDVLPPSDEGVARGRTNADIAERVLMLPSTRGRARWGTTDGALELALFYQRHADDGQGLGESVRLRIAYRNFYPFSLAAELAVNVDDSEDQPVHSTFPAGKSYDQRSYQAGVIGDFEAPNFEGVASIDVSFPGWQRDLPVCGQRVALSLRVTRQSSSAPCPCCGDLF